ncbi:gamma-glutamylcyclotransferase [bacterium]|nr:gamma-glutamylcyclotransferase [bacterium]
MTDDREEMILPEDVEEGEDQDAASVQPTALLETLGSQIDDAALLPATSQAHYLFAFDDLLDQATIARYVKGMRMEKIVCVPRHRLVFPYFYPPRETSLPSLIRTNNDNDEVWGVLYNLRGKDLKPLERHLKVPNRYHRRSVRIHDRGGNRLVASTYVLTITDEEHRPPSNAYRDFLVETARERGLPEHWLARLMEIDCED